MAFDIETFKSEHELRNSVLPMNRFKVRFPLPQLLLATGNLETARSVEYWCEGAQLPGYQLLSHNMRRFTYGTNETRPFAPNFQPIELTFAMDSDAEIWELFNSWTQSIMPHDAVDGINTSSVYETSVGAREVYQLAYKTEYVTDMNILIYDKNNNLIKNFFFREAFPTNINAVPLNWNAFDEYARFTVFIEYLDWYIE